VNVHLVQPEQHQTASRDGWTDGQRAINVHPVSLEQHQTGSHDALGMGGANSDRPGLALRCITIYR
jgi:hypothetical protein